MGKPTLDPATETAHKHSEGGPGWAPRRGPGIGVGVDCGCRAGGWGLGRLSGWVGVVRWAGGARLLNGAAGAGSAGCGGSLVGLQAPLVTLGGWGVE
ncbi:hypothetical protein GCM10018791_70550 [Streptomyces zaomyceticus]|nr:hypothetical protein GCM10018791_70550 [Streptomyces zaomyceticus]